MTSQAKNQPIGGSTKPAGTPLDLPLYIHVV